MLIQYEAMTHKSALAVFVGESSTSKAKGKRTGCWKRKKGKGKAVTATASAEGAPAAPKGKGKGKVAGSQRSKANDVCMHCQGKGYWKRKCMFVIEVDIISNAASWVLDTGYGAHICNNLQVLERNKRLSKDGMILRLGDGKTIAVEAVGSLSLVIGDHIRIELKDCYYVPRKMTKKPFVGQSAIASGLLDLVHTDVCRPLNTLEYRLEVENQTSHKIKALRSDRGGEYLSGEFIDYLKENEILSQWTPPGTTQLNGVAERRNQTLLDMVRSMMSFTELLPSFWGHALEMAAKFLNIASSKTVPRCHMRYGMANLRPISTRECGVALHTSRG
ncbi:UNVERIFIED_CONTAM: hypothetical protein Slati_0849200 [Sesamum latifolium]|uniref:Integrase catalytic domain-containing protein n=1 Tax=Sesamum latifolium TaxID=2727402 RepID=A0AAW2XTG2_9LAMI